MKRIWIIEPEQLSRRMYARTLAERYDLRIFESPAQAKRALEDEGPPNLLITELDMEGTDEINGTDLALTNAKRCPVIVIAASFPEHLRSELAPLEESGYVTDSHLKGDIDIAAQVEKALGATSG